MSLCRYAECHYAQCRYGECHYSECRYAECRYAERRYAECRCAERRGASSWRRTLQISDEKCPFRYGTINKTTIIVIWFED